MKQPEFFPTLERPLDSPSKSRLEKFEKYDVFTAKFTPKKTTDDCYTSELVYDIVVQWVRENADIEGREIVRPFWPGGDYEAYEYPDGCVVIDNPPFSIFSKICRFFMARGIRFFLFAPHLTLFSTRGIEWTCVVTDALITYENGAKVKTSFVSNLFGDVRIMTAPELKERIDIAQRPPKSTGAIYKFPPNIISAARMGKYVKRGMPSFVVRADQCSQVTKLPNGAGIFGGGFAITDSEKVKELQNIFTE